MSIHENLLEVRAYTEEGYKPVIDYGEWRVAILNYCDELLPQNILKMQQHNETDEVFVLLKGRCILFVGEGDLSEDANIYAQDMEPQKMYNIKKGVFHSHTLSEDAMVLIIENRDTTLDNSPEKELTNEQKNKLIEHTKKLWHR